MQRKRKQVLRSRAPGCGVKSWAGRFHWDGEQADRGGAIITMMSRRDPGITRHRVMRALLFAVVLLISSSSLADDAFVDTKTGFVFPQTVAGFSFKDKREYGDPGLGYGLNYWSKDGTLMTVIVYDLGIKGIEDGINGPRVQQQMRQAREDVDRAVDVGYYRAARLIDDVGVFSPLFLRASYDIVRNDGVQRRSHLFMRGQHEHFVKVRATGPADRQIDTTIANFLDQLLTIIGSDKQMQPAR